MLTGRRYRLGFSAEQVEYAERVAGICRSVWNTGLEQRREYRRRGAWINYAEQAGQLAEAKNEHPWLAEAPSHTLQQTLRDLDRACREHGTFHVRWRSKMRNTPSFRFPDPNHITVRRISRRTGRVKLPKFGPVNFRWSRPLGGTIRNATVLKDGPHWHISFCVEDGISQPVSGNERAVGVDRGVAVAAATSEGVLLDRQFVTGGEAKRLKRLQRQLARSQRQHGRNRPSNRRKQTRRKLQALNARVRARRGDFCAQTAATLTRSYGMVVLEDLKTSNMTASAKGTVEQPGTNVAQKAGLNRAILGKGWHRFELALASAARYTGTTIIKVNPAYTSQTCSACKHVASGSRESQAVFACVACGYQDHADVNAAKNILAAGLAVTGRGDLGTSRSVKRQPPKPRKPSGDLAKGIPGFSRGEEVNE